MSKNEIYQTFDFPFFTHKGIANNPLKAKKLFKGVNFKDKTVSDFGCCEGYYCFLAALHGASKVIGYDFDIERLDTAARIMKLACPKFTSDMQFKQVDLTDINYQFPPTDYTIFCSVSHHLPLLQTLRRVAAATKETAFIELLVDETLEGPVLKYQKGRQWVEEIIPSIECATAMLETYFKRVVQLPHTKADSDRVFFICHK